MAKLTDKQQRFVDEYLIDLNATQAAIRAGYSPKDADVQGPRLLGFVRVKAAIDTAMAERSKRTGINQDRVLTELAKIAFADMQNFVLWGPQGMKLRDSTQLTKDDTACIAEVSESTGKTYKQAIKLHDKKGALELIGRHLGMWNDKLDLKQDMTITVAPAPRPDVIPGEDDGEH